MTVTPGSNLSPTPLTPSINESFSSEIENAIQGVTLSCDAEDPSAIDLANMSIISNPVDCTQFPQTFIYNPQCL